MKKNIFYYLICILGFVLIARLFYIQIINEYYGIQLEKNVLKIIRVQAPRGNIYDRNDKLLVTNQMSYNLLVIPNDVKNLDTMDFCKYLGISKQVFISKMNKAKKISKYKPYLFYSKISKDDFAYFQEKMFNYKGFYVEKKFERYYNFDTAANVLGYIGEVNQEQLRKDKYYKRGDLVGITGVEKYYEKQLRGNNGIKYIKVDVRGRSKGFYFNPVPSHGNKINITLDIKTQIYAQQLMNNKYGSIVAIEPSSGEIIAMASSPCYKPSLLLGNERYANYKKLLMDTIKKPLFDRTVIGEYPPGSVFKIITGLIALQEEIVDENTKFSCINNGSFLGSRFLKCHCDMYSNNISLNKAIYRSCNSFFAKAYRYTIQKYPIYKGFDIWRKHVLSFGFGKYMNNDIYIGRKGFVPTSQYYDKIYGKDRWYATNNISNSIGQGEILITPIQLSNMITIIANRGYYYIPHIVKNIDKSDIDNRFKVKKYTSIDPKYFNIFIDGLKKVFEKGGTAYGYKIRGIEMAGKTGTVQNESKIDHSVFVAFAPVENPKIAISVIVERGYWGSRWAAPIASLIIEKYLNRKVIRKNLEKAMMNGSLMDKYLKK